MSIYTQSELNSGVVTGFLSEKIRAWHQAGVPVEELRATGRAFDGPVPPEVAERIVGWKPLTFKPGKLTLEHITDDGNVEFVDIELPDRLGQFVVNPNSRRLVNVAGDGYEADLHRVMAEAIELATDAGVEIASVVCLGDGAHMALTFRTTEGVILKDKMSGGVVPYIGYTTSLASFLSTQLQTGTVLPVCDNTIASSQSFAVAKLKVKRTRFSAEKLTAQRLRDALDISFTVTEAWVEAMEQLANLEVTDAQVSKVLNAWKPVPTDESKVRSITMAKKAHAEFRKELWGARNPFGQTVAGLLQSHNSYSHWLTPGAGKGAALLERQAQRTITGKVAQDDAAFAELLANLELVRA